MSTDLRRYNNWDNSTHCSIDEPKSQEVTEGFKHDDLILKTDFLSYLTELAQEGDRYATSILVKYQSKK